MPAGWAWRSIIAPRRSRRSTGNIDLVTSLEVIEHVADPPAFVDALAARLAPGGLLILSTPNPTGWSKLLTITLAEGLGRIPKGTHDFDKFIPPDELGAMLAKAGLKCMDVEGIAWSPPRGLHLSEDVRLNYLVAAVRTFGLGVISSERCSNVAWVNRQSLP